MSKWIMIFGATLLILGVVLHFVPSLFNWFGKLPGDIRWGSDRVKVFIPITSMLLISILLTIILHFIRR